MSGIVRLWVARLGSQSSAPLRADWLDLNALQSGREVDDKTLHIMFAANRWQASADLRKALQGGTTVGGLKP